MLTCVLYVFLSGASMINPSCVLDNDYVLVDRVEYVQAYEPYYSSPDYTIYYNSPFIVWNEARLYPRRYRPYYKYPRHARRGYTPWRRTTPNWRYKQKLKNRKHKIKHYKKYPKKHYPKKYKKKYKGKKHK